MLAFSIDRTLFYLITPDIVIAAISYEDCTEGRAFQPGKIKLLRIE